MFARPNLLAVAPDEVLVGVVKTVIAHPARRPLRGCCQRTKHPVAKRFELLDLSAHLCEDFTEAGDIKLVCCERSEYVEASGVGWA